MDSFVFKRPAGATVDITEVDDGIRLELAAIWGSGGVAITGIRGSGGVAFAEGEVNTLGQDTIELFDAIG